MVELSIPRQRLVTTEAPKDSISSRDYAASASAVGSGLQAIGSGLESIAVPLAEKKGKDDAAAAISYDADGKIVIGDPGTSFIWGKAGNAYASAKETEMLVAGRSQVDQDLIALRAKHEGNPQGFQKEAADYLNARKAANIGGIGQATFDYGLRASSGHYNNLVENRAARDFKQSSDVFNGRMELLNGQEQSIIAQGISSGPELDRIRAEKNQIRNEMEQNPRFNYNKELRAIDEKNDQQRLTGIAISYEGRRRVDAGEPLAVVQRDIEERLIKAGMPSDQVQKYIGLASSHMAGVSARRGAELQRFSDEADITIRQYQGGQPIDPAKHNELMQNLGRNGGERKAGELEFQRRMVERWKPDIESGDPTRKARALREMNEVAQTGIQVPGRVAGRASRAAPPELENRALNRFVAAGYSREQAAGMIGGLIQESSLNTGARNPGDGSDGSDSIGVAQWNADRARRLRSFAATKGKPVTDFDTQIDFVLHELETTEKAAGQRLKSAKTVQEAAAAAAGYERPKGWSEGNPQGAHGWENRLGHAQRLVGKEGLVSVPVPSAAYKEAFRTYTAGFNFVAARVAQQLDKGVDPAAQDMRDYEEMLPLINKDETTSKAIAKVEEGRRNLRIRKALPADSGPLSQFVDGLTKKQNEGQIAPGEVDALNMGETVLKERETENQAEFRRASKAITEAHNAGKNPLAEDVSIFQKHYPAMRSDANKQAALTALEAERNNVSKQQIKGANLSNLDIAQWEAAQTSTETRGGTTAEGARSAVVLREVITEREKENAPEFSRVAGEIIKSLKDGKPPLKEEMDRYIDLLPIMRNDANKEITRRVMEASRDSIVRTNLPMGYGLEAVNAYLQAQLAEGTATAQQKVIAQQTQAQLEQRQKILKDDPLALGRNRYSGPGGAEVWGQAGAIQWGNPDSMGRELTIRQMQSVMIRQPSMEPDASAMPLYAEDRKSLAAALPNMPADQAQATLDSLRARFSKDQMAALMGDEGVRSAIQGLTRSADPAKMQAGFAFIESRWRDNPMEFENTFGAGTEKQIARWLAWKDVMTPEKLAERMQKADDPRTVEQRKILESHAATEIEKNGSAEILKKMHREMNPISSRIPFNNLSAPLPGEGIPSATGMMVDYNTAFKIEYVANGGDNAAAEKFAMEKVRANWGYSEATGRVMRLPPEKSPAVPPLNGSHRWVREQFQSDAIKLLGVDRKRIDPFVEKWWSAPNPNNLIAPENAAAMTGKEKQALAILQGNYELAADARTEADMKAGRPPSYRVMIKSENGMIPMEKAPLDHFRWSPDVKAVNPEYVERDRAIRLERSYGLPVRGTRM